MANKRLNPQEVEEMKKMVQNGSSPEEISKHFGVAISSVHNYKKKFKESGLTFPSVRGRRPLGTTEVKPNVQVQQKPIGQVNSGGMSNANYKFIVNGVSVQVSGQARNVNIGKDSMEINF